MEKTKSAIGVALLILIVLVLSVRSVFA